MMGEISGILWAGSRSEDGEEPTPHHSTGEGGRARWQKSRQWKKCQHNEKSVKTMRNSQKTILSSVLLDKLVFADFSEEYWPLYTITITSIGECREKQRKKYSWFFVHLEDIEDIEDFELSWGTCFGADSSWHVLSPVQRASRYLWGGRGAL